MKLGVRVSAFFFCFVVFSCDIKLLSSWRVKSLKSVFIERAQSKRLFFIFKEIDEKRYIRAGAVKSPIRDAPKTICVV